MSPKDQIKALIRSGDLPQARRLLAAALQANPNDATAWWLLSFAVEEPARQVEALRRVLTLSPGYQAAERRLAEIDPAAATVQRRSSQARAAPAPAPETSVLTRQRDGLRSAWATPRGRLWTGALTILFSLTVAVALILNSSLRASAAERQAAAATLQFQQDTIAELSIAPTQLPDIYVLPNESESSPTPQPTEPDPLAQAAEPSLQPTFEPTLPPTPEPTLEPTQEPTPALPPLDQFARSLENGEPNQRVGVFVEDRFSFPIVQQPSADPAWISANLGVVTEFRIVRKQTGNEGIIAHNYLAGGQFYTLQIGDLAELVLGDGSVIDFEITDIQDYQALSPNSPTSNFINLNTGEKLTASDLFFKVYGGYLTLTFQTCISRDNISSWGRTFIIGEEL